MWGSAEQWHLFADRASVPIAYTDPDARVRFANATFERYFDFLPRSAVGQSLWDVIVPAGTTEDPIGQVQKGDALTFLACAKSKAGRTWNVWASCVPHREADGQLVGCVIVLTDAHDARVWELERRIVDAADTVRKEVGEDLHDNVGQQLTGLELMVDALARRVTGSDPVTGALVARVAERLRQVHADVRQLVTGIVPTEVPADGFVATLDRFVTRVRDHYGRGCELVTTDQVRLADAATATHLFRIVQEAVSNAIRHGNASAIRVTVRAGHDALAIEVRDNGGGFSIDPDGAGLGTRLMHDRAVRIGGTLTIATIDGGTVVTVRLPATAGDGM